MFQFLAAIPAMLSTAGSALGSAASTAGGALAGAGGKIGSMISGALPAAGTWAKSTALPAIKSYGAELGKDMVKDIATQTVSNMVMPPMNTAQPYIQNIQQPQQQRRNYIQNAFDRRNYLG